MIGGEFGQILRLVPSRQLCRKSVMQSARLVKQNTRTAQCLCNQMNIIKTTRFYSRNYSTMSIYNINRPILYKYCKFTVQQRRRFMILRIIRNVAKIRYLVLGAAGTAGVSAKLTYEKWKDKWLEFEEQIPQIDWMKQYYPSNLIDDVKGRFNHNFEHINDIVDSTKKLLFGIAGDIKEVSEEVANGVIEAVQPPVVEASPLPKHEPIIIFQMPRDEPEENKAGEETAVTTEEEPEPEVEPEQEPPPPPPPPEKEIEVDPELLLSHKREAQKLRELLSRAQEELLEMQHKLQLEIDRLERENQDLRKQIMLGKNKSTTGLRKMKRTLIDMYSDVLDLLAEYDSNYDIQDHLPRVVVIGDQSAGKTSVLEMIARARLFPRGSGQMMTRCPIMVTLTEGPNHVASFKGAEREYDLTKESEVKLLREEVERKMKKKLKGRRSTISTDVMSMSVKGPGLPRMVLVDLPGIISTETTEMVKNTKDSILDVSRHYMANPNAIILCIQDGSLDAERSIVTDLASQMDPTGKRTIFVMTKMDLAEANQTDPTRIQKILSGKLFPMKAMGYFAVVTGTGNNDDSIEKIKQSEEEFFRKSTLFKTGILKASQMTTQNLSFAVANCFWQMVRESTEQQSDAFKTKKFNLETEWKNNYPTLRELDRDELYDKARGEILDEVLSLSQTRPHEWEEILSKNLWNQVQEYAFEEIYLPAAQKGNPTEFKTKVDILLKQWSDRFLPDYAIQVGYSTLISEFAKAMEEGVEIGGKKDAHSILFDGLKEKVKKDCIENHNWLMKAKDSLRVIQLTALEDSNVPTKEQWDDAIKFMEDTIALAGERTEQELSDLIGPGWRERWVYWTSRSREQHMQNEIKKELDRLLFTSHEQVHLPELAEDEVTAVKRNLQTNNVEASPAEILRVWKSLYRAYFLDRSLQGLQECRKAYYHRNLAKNELECNDLILFWRFRKMLQSTSNSLRQQIMNTEARRLENEVKEILDEIGQDEDLKKELLQGRQVDLAEELKRVRHIQECLEQFVESLKREKTF